MRIRGRSHTPPRPRAARLLGVACATAAALPVAALAAALPMMAPAVAVPVVPGERAVRLTMTMALVGRTTNGPDLLADYVVTVRPTGGIAKATSLSVETERPAEWSAYLNGCRPVPQDALRLTCDLGDVARSTSVRMTLRAPSETTTGLGIMAVAGAANAIGPETAVEQLPPSSPPVSSTPEAARPPAPAATTAPAATPPTQPQSDPRSGPRSDPRSGPRSDPRSAPRNDPKSGPRNDPRNDPKSEPRTDPRSEPKSGPRNVPLPAAARPRPRPGEPAPQPQTPPIPPEPGQRSPQRPEAFQGLRPAVPLQPVRPLSPLAPANEVSQPGAPMLPQVTGPLVAPPAGTALKAPTPSGNDTSQFSMTSMADASEARAAWVKVLGVIVVAEAGVLWLATALGLWRRRALLAAVNSDRPTSKAPRPMSGRLRPTSKTLWPARMRRTGRDHLSWP